MFSISPEAFVTLPTPTLAERYARDGYVAPLDALVPAEAARCVEQLAGHLDAGGAAGARLRNNPHLLFIWADALIGQPRILDAVAALIGPDLLVRQTVLFLKPARDPTCNGWHQDGAYWDLEGGGVVTAWIALTDSSAANGAVCVVPGSHRGPRLPHELRTDRAGRLLRGQSSAAVAEQQSTCIELRAGQFSLHDPWVVHSSPGNPSDAPRIGLAVRYASPDVRQRGPRAAATLVAGVDRFGHADLQPRPRRDFDPPAAAWHRRALRRYALHVAWQIARQPTLANLRLLGRLTGSRDTVRALWRRPRP